MKVTKRILEQLTTDKGVMTAEAMEMLGVSYPLTKGWRKRCLGREISAEAYQGLINPMRWEDLETLEEYVPASGLTNHIEDRACGVPRNRPGPTQTLA